MILMLALVTAPLAAPARPAVVTEADGGNGSHTLDDLVAAKRLARQRFVRTDWNERLAIEDRDAVLAERRAALDDLRRLRREVRDTRREQRAGLSSARPVV